MVNYGEALRYQRDIAGLSLTDLGKKIGTSSQNLGRWERGEVIPNIDFCVRLANFYGISIDELLGLDSNFQTVTAKAPAGGNTAEERGLLEDYHELSKEGKELVKATIKTLLGSARSGKAKKA